MSGSLKWLEAISVVKLLVAQTLDGLQDRSADIQDRDVGTERELERKVVEVARNGGVSVCKDFIWLQCKSTSHSFRHVGTPGTQEGRLRHTTNLNPSFTQDFFPHILGFPTI